MRLTARLAGGLLAAVLVLTGCAGDDPEPLLIPGRPNVEVDTPELREAKQAAGVEDCAATDAGPVEGGLPDLELPCFGGGPDVNVGGLRGPMVVNLWASWCGPCRREMPVLQSFHEQYGDAVPVLGVDWQDVQTAAAMELVAEVGVTYPLLADPAADLDVVDGLPVRGLPGIVLLDEDGTVAYRALEEIETEQQLVDLVAEHLGVVL